MNTVITITSNDKPALDNTPFRRGDIICRSLGAVKWFLMICKVGDNDHQLIDLKSGNRWSRPFHKAGDYLSFHDVAAMLGDSKFTRVSKADFTFSA